MEFGMSRRIKPKRYICAFHVVEAWQPSCPGYTYQLKAGLSVGQHDSTRYTMPTTITTINWQHTWLTLPWAMTCHLNKMSLGRYILQVNPAFISSMSMGRYGCDGDLVKDTLTVVYMRWTAVEMVVWWFGEASACKVGDTFTSSKDVATPNLQIHVVPHMAANPHLHTTWLQQARPIRTNNTSMFLQRSPPSLNLASVEHVCMKWNDYIGCKNLLTFFRSWRKFGSHVASDPPGLHQEGRLLHKTSLCSHIGSPWWQHTILTFCTTLWEILISAG